MRLLVVSNRLPVNVAQQDGELTFQPSSGGLVSGLSAYLDSLKGTASGTEYIWVGWPGVTVDQEAQADVKEKLQSRCNAYPVFLEEDAMDNFYHGFCNKIIWPLFHYFTTYAEYDDAYWSTYKSVNETFCAAVLEVIKPGDVVWIHDYHLMLLPRLLRERLPEVPIGFFLHIPFPSFEVFRLLPEKWRKEILVGLLGADLVGFHTYEYTQYFTRCVRRILGYQSDAGLIKAHDKVVRVGTFPMGIDFDRFYQAGTMPEVLEEKAQLAATLSGLKVVLSIDRLDYSKGIANRLRGYESFLRQYPQWCGKVVLLLVVVPSRIGVEHYQQLKKQIDELVGEINGRFGSVNWAPIIYQYKFLPFYPLVAVYGVSDVALVTPLRDGMNLIAKEYVASRVDQTGVLILSEMAGTVKEAGEAIIINPNSVDEIVQALTSALDMPEEEQIKRNQVMQARFKRYDVMRWSGNFIQTLLSANNEQRYFAPKSFNGELESLLKQFRLAHNRLILLDYDGTLVPFNSDPASAVPDSGMLNLLKDLSADPKAEVAVISGRSRQFLEEWLGTLNIGLVGEHCAWMKDKQGNWRNLKPLLTDWKPRILPILERYADRLPGSFVEEKEFALAWHYRAAASDFASSLANELTDDLLDVANVDTQVIQGDQVIEIRCSGMSKALATQYWISKKDFDFILAIGDDWTDEDMFRVLPERAFSFKVGEVQSYARFNLPSQSEVINLLEKLRACIQSEGSE